MNRLLKVIALSFFLLGSLQAQWYVIASLVRPFNNLKVLFTRRGGGIFFEQGRIWVSPSEDGSGNTINDEIFVSSDTGMSWGKVTLPTLAPSLTINDLSFFSKDVGAAVFSNNGHLVVTNDGGLTWVDMVNGGGFKIKMLSSSRIIGTFPFGASTDGGVSWQTTQPDISFDLCADNNGILYSAGDKALFISRDSGLTWIKRNEIWNNDIYGCSAHSSCNDSVIYINNENISEVLNKTGSCHLYASTDGGLTFRSTLASGNLYLTGTVICGKRGLAYCSTFDGLMMTTDYGNTWNNIGGPGEILDAHSFALINDSTIVALDTMGNIWMTTNSNFHPIPKPEIHHPITKGFSLTDIASCDSVNGVLTVEHTFCSPLVVTRIDRLLTSSPKFIIGNISLPDTIDQTKIFTVPISFNPDKAVGTFTGGVQVHGFYLDEGDTIWIDEPILFSAVSKPVPPILISSSAYFGFDKLSTCLPPEDSTVILTNKGCDTLQIISGPGAMSSELSLITPLVLPVKLAPDSSLHLTFRFKPTGTGVFFTTAKFLASQQTLTQDVTITLRGEGEREVGILSYTPQRFSFPTLSICAHDSASGFVTNIGCDSIALDPGQILGDPDFRLTGIETRFIEKPQDTIRYTVYLDPVRKGMRKGYLVLSSNDGTKAKLDSIPISVEVTDGSRILSSSLSSCDFGTSTLCDESDTTLILRNIGCDTVIIYTASLSGSGFGVSGIGDSIILLPERDTSITIGTLNDTTGGKLVNTATLRLVTNANDTLPPIILKHALMASAQRNLGVTLGPALQTGKDSDIIQFDLLQTPASSFIGAGIKTITFDLLNYDTDLLTFNQSKSSSNLSSFDGKSFTLTGVPEIVPDANGVLASIGFTVFLTKDSTTTLDLANVVIDTTHAPCTTLSINNGGSATFDYRFSCGERTLAGFMNGSLPLSISSLRPNPAQEEILLEVRSTSQQRANIEVRSALGVMVYSAEGSLVSGTNIFHIDTKVLADGMYVVRVGGASQKFAKVK